MNDLPSDSDLPLSLAGSAGLRLALAVLRVSTGEQVAGTSLPEQEAACEDAAARDGFDLIGVYSDEGLSGTLFSSRAGLQEALARLGELRRQYPSASLRLYFSAVDRATREASVLPAIRRALKPLRASIAYASVTIDNSPSGRFIENSLGSVAELERELIRERTTRGKLAKARQGLQSARGYRPFGYDIVMKKDVYPGSKYGPQDVGRYFIREDEEKIVRHLFEEYAAGQLSLRKAAAYLNAQGSLTPRGNVWSYASLHCVLKSPLYKGEAFYGRDEHWREEVGGEVKRRRLRRSEGDIITIPCPAIVSAEVWERVQDRFASNKQTLSGNPGRRYLLSGLLRCPACGRKLQGHRRWRDGMAYGCTNNKECGRHVPADQLEAGTLAAIEEVISQPQIVRAALESYQRRSRRVVPAADGGAIRSLRGRRRVLRPPGSAASGSAGEHRGRDRPDEDRNRPGVFGDRRLEASGEDPLRRAARGSGEKPGAVGSGRVDHAF